MSPRYPEVRTGDITWDGISNVIAAHIVYNNESEVFPRFDRVVRDQESIEVEVDTLKVSSINFTNFLKAQEKRDKQRNRLLWAIVAMLSPILGDLIWYWFRIGFHLK